jgi:hypothetical protein
MESLGSKETNCHLGTSYVSKGRSLLLNINLQMEHYVDYAMPVKRNGKVVSLLYLMKQYAMNA